MYKFSVIQNSRDLFLFLLLGSLCLSLNHYESEADGLIEE